MLIEKEVTCWECEKTFFRVFWVELQSDDGICPECLDAMDNE